MEKGLGTGGVGKRFGREIRNGDRGSGVCSVEGDNKGPTTCLPPGGEVGQGKVNMEAVSACPWRLPQFDLPEPVLGWPPPHPGPVISFQGKDAG